MFIRFLLWFLLFLFVWRLMRALTSGPKKTPPKAAQSGSRRRQGPPFDNVEEAEFEDLSKSSPQNSDKVH